MIMAKFPSDNILIKNRRMIALKQYGKKKNMLPAAVNMPQQKRCFIKGYDLLKFLIVH